LGVTVASSESVAHARAPGSATYFAALPTGAAVCEPARSKSAWIVVPVGVAASVELTSETVASDSR
jgi:hypothetical protein